MLGSEFLNLPQSQTGLSSEVNSICNLELLNLAGIQVLAVDDRPDERVLVAAILESFGAEVLTVSSAVEALSALVEFQPQILVSDIAMPDMDGFTLLQQIRQQSTTQQIPAIALTSYVRLEDCQQALAVGFNRHLAKPVDPLDLVSAVAALVSRS